MNSSGQLIHLQRIYLLIKTHSQVTVHRVKHISLAPIIMAMGTTLCLRVLLLINIAKQLVSNIT